MVAWYVAAGEALMAHVIVLAIVSRLARLHTPLAEEAAGIPLVLQSVQVLAAASLSPPATSAPRRIRGLDDRDRPTGAPAVLRHHAAVVNTASVDRSGSGSRAAGRSAAGPVTAAPMATQGAGPTTQATAAGAGEAGSALVPALEARIDEAVRQAATMQEAARRQHRQGRSRVKFTYFDGRVKGVQLVAPSQSVLDDTALQAVKRAAYPPPPEALRGRHLDLLVWMNFRLEA